MQGLSLTESISIKKDKYSYLDRLERLFFVRDMEIPGFLSSGSAIPDFFWEPATPQTINKIIFEVKRLVTTYEPNMLLRSIIAGFIPLESKELLFVIELEFAIKSNPEDLQKLTITKIREDAE